VVGLTKPNSAQLNRESSDDSQCCRHSINTEQISHA